MDSKAVAKQFMREIEAPHMGTHFRCDFAEATMPLDLGAADFGGAFEETS